MERTQETFSDLNSTAQDLSDDTKHDISWKYPSDTFDFNFLGFRQIACYLAEQFRQIACYLAERFRRIASSISFSMNMVSGHFPY